MRHEHPKLKDWTPGTYQIGLFIRLKDGGVVSMVNNEATSDEAAFVLHLIGHLRDLPAGIIERVRAAWESRVKEKL